MISYNLIWSDEDQKFLTMPDGDVATHKEIKEYYESKKSYSRKYYYGIDQNFRKTYSKNRLGVNL